MKKLLALMLALLMVFAFCGCSVNVEQGKNDADGNSAENAEAQNNGETAIDNGVQEDENLAVEENAEKAVLKMGTNAAFPPYEYKEGEEIVGIDAEIAAAIADKLGMELVIEDMEFDSIITAVQMGGVDFGMAGMTVTEERLEEVDFSLSYATGVQVVIVAEDSDIADLDGLAGKKIGVQLGTTGDIYASGDYGSENVIQYGKGADAIIALKGGDVDAVIIDNEPAKSFVAANEGLKILETEYAIEDYAIAVAKENTELLDNINEALKELTVDGTIDAIIGKYISAE